MFRILEFLIFIIVSIFISSCQKVIDLKLPETDPKVVVNSFFTDNSQIKVHLSKSIGILESIAPDITDASVRIRENGVIIDTMYLESGYYYSNILAVRNSKYTLEVIVPGMKPIYCEDIIPEKTILQSCTYTDSVLFDEYANPINELKLDFQDATGPSFYEIELEAKDVIQNYKIITWFVHISDPVITSTGLLDYNPRTLVFTDKLFDGKHCSVTIYFANDPYPYYDLKVSLRSVSESYFKYKEKQFAYLFNLHQDIFNGMNEPINLYSNIKGGYGIFAGYSSAEKVIIVR